MKIPQRQFPSRSPARRALKTGSERSRLDSNSTCRNRLILTNWSRRLQRSPLNIAASKRTAEAPSTQTRLKCPETAGDFGRLLETASRARSENALTTRRSSIFLRRMVGSTFMRVKSKCAHQVRPPPGWFGWCSAAGYCLATSQDQSLHVATHSEDRLRQPSVYRFESLSPRPAQPQAHLAFDECVSLTDERG